MSEDLATRQQIKKLYAVIRNSGMDPKTYVKKILEEKGRNTLNEFPKAEVSEMIDEFEGPGPTPTSTPNSNSAGKAEVVEGLEEDKYGLKEIGAIFNECVVRATNLVYRRFGKTERSHAPLIVDIAKLYFEEARKEAKMEELRRKAKGG